MRSEQSIKENRAEELLNWIDVHAGEMIYVAGGHDHYPGAGLHNRGDPALQSGGKAPPTRLA